MNKVELIEAIAESAGLSKKDAERAVKAFVEAVGEYERKAASKERTKRGITEYAGNKAV